MFEYEAARFVALGLAALAVFTAFDLCVVGAVYLVHRRRR
jgi:hypothetical protein